MPRLRAFAAASRRSQPHRGQARSISRLAGSRFRPSPSVEDTSTRSALKTVKRRDDSRHGILVARLVAASYSIDTVGIFFARLFWRRRQSASVYESVNVAIVDDASAARGPRRCDRTEVSAPSRPP